ncbi:hypothetical protein [Streptosporangium sp. NBC_01756]|nr:hypothetical protein [Streptosporangium sp. NBC_01756]WSC88118.1 hypothetical protein OIE48_07930 [Streptosporangium sp. NBC_01756]
MTTAITSSPSTRPPVRHRPGVVATALTTTVAVLPGLTVTRITAFPAE